MMPANSTMALVRSALGQFCSCTPNRHVSANPMATNKKSK